ncbi:HAMP domain-containing protein [Microbacterium protaetiae]|uniref:histidine kinase n=1 Tax=Microbacterium protaetiae TaxID=2509458 RepID=A0A4V0YDJ0_9MICO|nr:ATP-binding protein [Microbacterium protaetiae]QAY60881.1 HAMP domain-containing protein [Microbacterium protaetiae]
MATVIGIVALILAAVALATGAILGSILQQNLDNKVQESVSSLRMPRPSLTGSTLAAYQILQESPPRAGFLLVAGTVGGVPDGAYIDDDGAVQQLTARQVEQVVSAVEHARTATVEVDSLGAYHVRTGVLGNTYAIAGGLPITEVNQTIAQILTTVGLVTFGGLLLLAAAIAVVIRQGLQPLRAVADTATRVAELPMSEGEVSISERVPVAPGAAGTEIGRVGTALNTLLDHVGASLQQRQHNEERMRSFVADASHELRTPLASIRGYSELSLRDPELGDSTQQALERIQAQSLRMTALVEDLLLLARLDEGQELVFGAVDLTRLAVEATGDAQVAGGDHSWIVDVPEEPIIVAGDAARLHQVIANLLANARTHTPAGTEVTTRVSREGTTAVLSVHDDGPGIDPSIADELFERFARADRSRARKTGGTGLGLSIARAIVAAHHGTITVRSIPHDTTFEVRLPARPADPPPAQ